ncbi:MAG: hypothetical protein AAF717_00190 [Bacteroidota bacterium]
MTKAQEQEINDKRDKAWLNAAIPVYKGSPKTFIEDYIKIQPLYNGTSFQKKHYPEAYKAYLSKLENNQTGQLTINI